MNLHPTRILHIVGIVLSITVARAQSSGNQVERLTGRLYSITNRYSPAVYRSTEDYRPEFISALFNTSLVDSVSLAREARSNAYQTYVRRDLGLRAFGTYINNFTDGFEELGFFFRSSYNLGLEWNVLKDGFYSNQFSARETGLNDQIKRETSARNNPAVMNFMLDRVNGRFDKDILEKKRFVLQFISEYEKLSRDLYLARFILWEDYLGISNRKKELELDINQTKPLVQQALRPNTLSDQLPLLALVDSTLSSLIRPNANALLQLKDEENNLRYAFWRDISLRPFVRYNHFVYDVAIPDRDFLSGGLSVSVPLSFRNKTVHEVKATSRHELRAELTQQFQSDQVLLVALTKQYNETLSRYLKHLNNCHLLEEQLRKESVKKEVADPEYTPMRTLMLLRDWLEEDIVLIETKAALYRILAQLAYVTKTSPEEFTRPLVIPYETFTQQTAKEKSIYLWSSAFRKHTVSTIADYLSENDYSAILLSVDMNDSLRLKALDLVNLLQQRNISVELMIANNSILLKESESRLAEALKFNSNVPGIRGIHFDVEPHTRDDWRDNKAALMAQYREMITYARTVLPKDQFRISVSIPVSYEMEELRQVKEEINDVYLMAYERPEVAYIKKKITEEIAAFGDKLVIALSLKDFQNEEAMETFMEELKKATGINRFAVHDYSLVHDIEKRSK